MRRIVITLIISVVVFAATVLVSILYISRTSLATADYFNNLALDNFRNELNDDVLLTRQSAFSFLTGIPSVSVGSDSTSIIIEEAKLSEFKAGIQDVLIQFMSVNKYYKNSMFVIDADVCCQYFRDKVKNCSRGYAPAVRHGENTLYDLSGEFDYMGSGRYQEIKRERKILWATPGTGEEGLLTLQVPLTLDNGQFFGVFALSLDIETVSQKLKKYLPFGEKNSAIFLVDENDNIFSSYPKWIEEADTQEAIRNSTNLLQSHYNGDEHCIIKFRGKKFYVYQRDGLLLPWRVFTSNNSKAIYRDARHVVNALILTSITGMLLMLLCCIVIFRQIRENLRKKAAAEEELRMAAMVQTSMLKPANHSFSNAAINAFMRPAIIAGGDLYDYIEKDGKLIFCIGDVSGKGMPAALFMTQVVSLFRNAVRFSSEPSEIVSQVNTVLSGNPDMTFCTFFVGVLDGEEIKFCNAGHNPPVLISSGAEFLDVKPNLAIGLKEGYQYQSETIPFHSGDVLVLYTDGVTEAKDKARRQYGEKRLLELMGTLQQSSSQEITVAIRKSIEDFVRKAEQSDDITIVSIVKT